MSPITRLGTRTGPRLFFGLAVGVLALSIVTAIAVSNSRDSHTAPVPPPSTSTSAVAEDDHRPLIVAVIGDSFTEGTKFGGQGSKAWPKLAEAALNRSGKEVLFRVSGRGGSGYLSVGPRRSTFITEAERILSPDVDLVIFVGSGNDVRQDSDDGEEAAVLKAVQTARDKAPQAAIMLVGPAWLGDAPIPANRRAVRDATASAANKASVEFIDPLASQWFKGRPELVGGDRIHPNDAGHQRIADLLIPAILSSLNSLNRNE